MTEPRFGRETRVKVLGGEVLYKQAGADFVTLRRRITETKRRALDMRPVFERFRSVWLGQTERVFDAEGIPRWPALSPGYAAWKARRFPGRPILVRTGALRASLTGGRGTIWEATPRTMRYGTTVAYFGYHQNGTSRMPARPPLVLLPETWDQLQAEIGRYLTEGLGRG